MAAVGATVFVACGRADEGDSTFGDLPEGVFLAVRTPDDSGAAMATLDQPLEAVVQVDSRIPGSNCSLRVAMVVSNDDGSYAQRRLVTLKAPLPTDVLTFSFAFVVDPDMAAMAERDDTVEVPFQLPAPGVYLSQVQATLIAPEVDDPTTKFSDLAPCRSQIALAALVTTGLESNRYFELTVEQGSGVVSTSSSSSTTPPTAGSTSSSSSSTTTTPRWTGGGGSRTTTTTSPATSTTRPAATTTTRPATTTTTTSTTVADTSTTEAPTTSSTTGV